MRIPPFPSTASPGRQASLLRVGLPALLAACLFLAAAPPQQSGRSPEQEEAYTRTLVQRADKIVATLDLADTNKAGRVRDLIVAQYRALSAVHEARDARIRAARSKPDATPAAIQAAIEKARAEAKPGLDALHAGFLAQLARELTPEQVDRVKDGMTYGVVQVTYNAYLKMLPDLTEAQKRQIMAWLVEARELAMDEGSAEDKHKVFGKYKGRINNYLAAAGYDLKQAERNLKNARPEPAGGNAK